MFGPSNRIEPAARLSSSCRARPPSPLSPKPLASTMAAPVPRAASARTASMTLVAAEQDEADVRRLRQRGDVRITAVLADRLGARIDRIDLRR